MGYLICFKYDLMSLQIVYIHCLFSCWSIKNIEMITFCQIPYVYAT